MTEKPWWDEMFDDDYLRAYARSLTPERTEAEAEGIRRLLPLDPGARLLDLCCGQGRHAALLAARGVRVTGLDRSRAMLRAAPGLPGFGRVRGDMRSLPFPAGSFDAACNIFTAFGYFEEEEENRGVLREVLRVLRPGGAFLLETINRDAILPGGGLAPRMWEEGEGLFMLDEHTFHAETSRIENRRILLFADGRRREVTFSVRCYSAHELAAALKGAGFEAVRIAGSLREPDAPFHPTQSRRLVAVARRPG